MKKWLIIIGVLVGVLVCLIGGGIFFALKSLGPVNSKDDTKVMFTINQGESLKTVIDNLKEANLINNKIAAIVYVKYKDIDNIQAGNYELRRDMKLSRIMEKFTLGDVVLNTVDITFIEGKRITRFAKDISDHFNYTEEEVLEYLNNPVFVKKCIEKYWFLDDSILNKSIYYPLEGYLFPDTYTFYENETLENIFLKMLDNTSSKLEPLKDQITESKYSVHEIITMASIIELEGNTLEDRSSISQVIFKRLEANMELGMDVTTYYAVKKEMGEDLTFNDLSKVNPYNTRDKENMAGKLPIGPICNPSLESINSVFNPSKTNYLYFYADIKTGQVYFSETYQGFLNIIKELS